MITRRVVANSVIWLLLAFGLGRIAAAQPASFPETVDLSPFDAMAVHVDGRLKSFESFARGHMQFVTGPRQIAGQPSTFTYLDLMLRPQAYDDVDLIYVKKKPMRAQIIQALRQSSLRATTPDFDQRMNRFLETGLVAERFVADPAVQQLLDRLSRDLIRTAKFVDMIGTASAVRQPAYLRSLLRIVPPVDGGFEDRWLTIDELSIMIGTSGEDDAAIDRQQRIVARWSEFTAAWRAGDAETASRSAATLVDLLHDLNPDVYPDRARLGWESWYFRAKNMTWTWLVYLLAIIPLLLSIVYRWRGAGWLGLGVFLVAFGLHTFAIMLRWYVAGRWPNSNMFEAITTAAWFGGCFAVLLELFALRHSPMRNVVALCSAVGSMFALMAVRLFPLQLNPGISNMMPVLHDVWLYIHTNVIIFSYCLIFMAAVSALLYLLYRAVGRAGGFGGPSDFARVGGAGSLIMTNPDGSSYLVRARTGFGQVLDGVTMVLMELAFILLWAGIVMGAIWADHSWGRPWGWDPKEVFALNTFIIFAVLVHVRLKVRDKGMWTALLALIGCAVMLFNWIVINFFIVGLHSYA